MCPYLSLYVRKLFPEPSSRLVCAVSILVAASLSCWWLIYTIQQKWINGIQNPQQVITYEDVASLPSFLRFEFDTLYPSANDSYLQVLPLWE
jgi:hypothetical protein